VTNPRCVITAIGLLSACSAQADGDARLRHLLSLGLEQLMQQKVTISTHTEQPLSRAPSVVTLITADDIRATGATNLAEVLQGVPGIYIRYQHFGLRPLISFRGANNKQTLLMINGAPMSDLMWRLGIFWKGLPTSMIERVEIIRGPGSALFGTDASAGVINVITKTAGKIEGSQAGVRGASNDSQSAWLQYGGVWNGFDLGVTADLSTTDGHDPLIATDAQTGNDLANTTSASLAPGHAGYGYRNSDLRFSLASDRWRLHLDYARHDDLETGMTGAGALDPVTEGSDSRFDVALLYDDKRFSEHWGVDAELRYRHIDYTSGDGFQE
jgi:iron complex outermembrane receptor protein